MMGTLDAECREIKAFRGRCYVSWCWTGSPAISPACGFRCTDIRHSIGAENLVPKEVNYAKIAIRVTVMNKVQFLAVV